MSGPGYRPSGPGELAGSLLQLVQPLHHHVGDRLVGAAEGVILALDPPVGDGTWYGPGCGLQLGGRGEGISGPGNKETGHLKEREVLDPLGGRAVRVDAGGN